MKTFLVGIVAGTLCAISFIPQVLKILKTKETKNLSLVTFMVFSAGVFLWLIYGIMIMEWPVIIANGVIFTLAILVVIMKIKYG